MSAPVRASTCVMISSVMRDREEDRAAVARIIEMQGDVPWFADKPPHGFSNISGESLSFRMAENCDLYLLIIFPRYGTTFDDDPRSVTHQEYDHARRVNPYKVEVFIAAEAKEQPESDALHDFITEVSHFRDGYSPRIFHSLAELQDQVLAALNSWHDGGNTGRNAYGQAVANEYRTFRNPVTGKEMDYDDTVQLKLRARLEDDSERPEANDDAHGDGSRRDRRQRRERGERADEKARIHDAAASPPQVLRELLTQQQRVVVIGDVGSGKSTLLKRMAHDTASDYFQSAQGRLPILVTATRLGRAAIEQPGQPLAIVVGLLQQDDTRFDALRQTINRTVSEALNRGDTLLLIDGLDEASTTEQSAVFALLGQIGTNHAVLASRPAAYGSQLADWQLADLQQLGPEQRRELVFQVFAAETAKGERPPTEQQLQLLADALLADLRGRASDLAAWAGNPLLLTLIAVQYLRDQRLPDNRARIYEFALEDLQRQRPTTARRALTERELETYLRLLALRMTHALRRDTTIAEVRDKYLPGYGFSTEVAREILERSGVLQRDAISTPAASDEAASDAVSDEYVRYEFVHISFREYLAACAMAGTPEWQRYDLARRHCLHQAWEQVLILLVNRLDLIGRSGKADDVIRVLIQADNQRIAVLRGPDPTHLALRLATRCALSRGKLTSVALMTELKKAWRPIWRAEERWLMNARELTGMIRELSFLIAGPPYTAWKDSILRMLPDSDELADEVGTVPGSLYDAAPLFESRGRIRGLFKASTWWIVALLMIGVLMGILYIVVQVTLGIGSLASSGWGHLVGRDGPVALLLIVWSLVILRLYGITMARFSVRREMLDGIGHRFGMSEMWHEQNRNSPLDVSEAWINGTDTEVAVSLFRKRGVFSRLRAAHVLASRQVTRKQLRRLYRAAVHPQGGWIVMPLRVLHWLTDWPVIVAVILAQAVLVFPAITERVTLPQPMVWLFGLTAWWQVLVIVVMFAGFYLLTSYPRAKVVHGKGRQEEREAIFDALESVIRRQVADTDSKTLADGNGS